MNPKTIVFSALIIALMILPSISPIAGKASPTTGGEWLHKFHPQFLSKISKLRDDTVVEAVVRLKPVPPTILEKVRGNYHAAVALLKQWSHVTQAQLTRYMELLGVKIVRKFWIDNVVLVKAKISALKKLAEHPMVEEVFENFEVHLLDKTRRHKAMEEKPGEIGAYQEVESWGIYKIRAPEAWAAGYMGDGVRIAVLDTGVDISHPALEGKMFTVNPGDPYYPGGWIEFDSDGNPVCSEPHDTHGHGTHTSGTALGGDGENIVIGVAPHAKLMHGLVIPSGSGTFASVLAGIEWAVEPYDCNGNPTGYPAHVISMSLGASNYYGSELLPGIKNALLANIVVVAAIGNDGPGTSSNPGNVWGVIGVGATDINDNVADFSSGEVVNWDNPPSDWPFYDTYPTTYIKPDVSAPGVSITSAVPGGGYEAWDGTSMATPHVAGTVALILQAAGWLNFDEPDTPEKVYEILNSTAVDLGDPGQDTRYGWGRIDTYEAVMRAKEYAKTTGVEGVVLDSTDSSPVTWATVHVSETNQTVAVNSTGGFKIPLDPGNYTLVVSAWGYEDKVVTVTVTVLNGTIAGYVTDAVYGTPVAGATVTATGGNVSATTTTNATGYYSVSLPPGTYNVTVEAPDYEPAWQVADVSENETTRLDFQLTPLGNGTIAGHVYSSEDGQPIEGALVWVEVDGDIVYNLTDATGYYELSVPAGVYTVHARANGYRESTVENVSVAPYETTTVDFYLEPLPPVVVVLGNVHYNTRPHIAEVLSDAGYDVVEYDDVSNLLNDWLVNGTINPKVIVVDHWKADRSLPSLDEVLALLDAANATNVSLVFLGTSYSSTEGIQALYEHSDGIEAEGYPAPDTRLYAYPSPTSVLVQMLQPDHSIFNGVEPDNDNWFYLADPDNSDYADYVVYNFTDDPGVDVLAYVNDTYNNRYGVGVAIWYTPSGTPWVFLGSWGESYWMQYREPGADGVYSNNTEKVLVNAVSLGFMPLSRSPKLGKSFADVLEFYYEFLKARNPGDKAKPVLGPKAYTKIVVRLDREPHGYVKGRVVGSDGAILVNATVEALDTPMRTMTDASGRFTLWLPLGEYTLRISKEGYKEKTVSVTISSEGQVVNLGDIELVMVPRIAIFLDYSGQIKRLIEDNLGWYAKDYDNIDSLINDLGTGFYNLVIFAGHYSTSLSSDLPRDKFLQALDVAGNKGINIIFLDQWGDYAYGINALHTYLGDPASRGTGYDESVYIYVRVEKKHPVFKGYDVGDMIQLHVRTGEDYAAFRDFSGEVIGTLYIGTSYYGDSIAVKETEYGTKWLLMASFAPEEYTPISDWTYDAVTVLLNAIKWMTMKPLTVTVEPSEAHVGDRITVKATGAPDGTEIVFYFRGEEVGRARTAAGRAEISFTVPVVPGGSYTVEAMSVDELYYGTAVLTVTPKTSISETHVTAPGVVEIEATGLPASEEIEIRLDSNYLTTITTTSSGTLEARINIPLVASGEHQLALSTRTGTILDSTTIYVTSMLEEVYNTLTTEIEAKIDTVASKVDAARASLSSTLGRIASEIAGLYNSIDSMEEAVNRAEQAVSSLRGEFEEYAGILLRVGNSTGSAVSILVDLRDKIGYLEEISGELNATLGDLRASLDFIAVNSTGKIYAALDTLKGTLVAKIGEVKEGQQTVLEKLGALLEATGDLASKQDIEKLVGDIASAMDKINSLFDTVEGLKDIIVSKTGEVYALVNSKGEDILLRLGELKDLQNKSIKALGEAIRTEIGKAASGIAKAVNEAKEEAASASKAAKSSNETVAKAVTGLKESVEQAKTYAITSTIIGGITATLAALAAIMVMRRP